MGVIRKKQRVIMYLISDFLTCTNEKTGPQQKINLMRKR